MIRTSSPVQNMGHLFHGVSLTSPSHVLRYGSLTAKGTTGGVSFEAPAGRLNSAEPAAIAVRSQCIGYYSVKIAQQRRVGFKDCGAADQSAELGEILILLFS